MMKVRFGKILSRFPYTLQKLQATKNGRAIGEPMDVNCIQTFSIYGKANKYICVYKIK